MTDSTTEERERGIGVAPSATELFGEIAEDGPLGDDPGERSPDEGDDRVTVDDRTASEVFDRLRDERDDGDADDLLADESPADIIASADDPNRDGGDDHEAVDDALLVDEAALEDLLLTGRTEGEEFLWVDGRETGASAEPTLPADRSEGGDETGREADSSTDRGPIEGVDETERGVTNPVGEPDDGTGESAPVESETDGSGTEVSEADAAGIESEADDPGSDADATRIDADPTHADVDERRSGSSDARSGKDDGERSDDDVPDDGGVDGDPVDVPNTLFERIRSILGRAF